MEYFMAFDFYDSKINKFWSGIVDIDLRTENMIDVAKKKAKETLPYYDCENITIKIIAFNNIEVE